ncbi:MAG: alpha/beta hydrolase [Pirellulales bacterium]|nr:alpha/beta hydrolase [Pirellulales bacterium]
MRKHVEVAGTRLQVLDEGAGPVVLLVHGFPLDHTMWCEQIPVLASSYRVVAPDLRGFGGSAVAADGTAPEVLPMEQFADDLAALLDGLAIDEQVTFCGLSMGGYIGWQFWRRHRRRVGRLMLCDTRALPDTTETARGRLQTAATVAREGRAVLARAMVPKLFAAQTLAERSEIIAACRATIEGTPATTIAAALRGMAARQDSTDLLVQIDVPTLVLCGTDDAITPLDEMRKLAGQIAGARFVEIGAAGHMAPLENPAATNAAFLEFLRSS